MVKLAGFVSSILTANITDPSSTAASSFSTTPNNNTIIGAATRDDNAETPSLSLRCRGTLITVLPVPKSRHALVLQTNPAFTGVSVPIKRLRAIQHTLTLLFGPPLNWADNHNHQRNGTPRLVTEGIEDLVDGLLSTLNPTLLIGGVRKVQLPDTTVSHLNRALKTMPKETEHEEAVVSSSKKTDPKEPSNEEKQSDQPEEEKTSSIRKGGGLPSTSTKGLPYRVALLTHNCNSVLHSRINNVHLSRLMVLLQLRNDVESFETTATPVYHDGGRSTYNRSSTSTNKRNNGSNNGSNNGTKQWYQLVVQRVQRGVLVCEFPISDVQPSYCMKYMTAIQRELYMSCNNLLPAEEPPVPLHLFVDHDTVAFVVYDRINCTSVCPQLRPSGSMGETDRLWKLFWIFLSTALDTWKENSRLKNISLVEGDIKFQAIRHEEIGQESVDVFVMTTASKTDEDTKHMAREIVTKMS
jgi:hypothetical protein